MPQETGDGVAFHTLTGIFVHQRTNDFGRFGFPHMPSRAEHPHLLLCGSFLLPSECCSFNSLHVCASMNFSAFFCIRII
ncbi:hypothetical protein BDA96_03G405300 [Sorghum bicolor]|uniref:Uncharacterized protein n=2 Tax=Sorghum bicolor TaxID=4558 RepID=A0A921RHK7_SORBI|nr:hypothetical protein BDA96_03G405300 [Sorghum bicolor]KXG33805.1 hypothetical protein SORBI_3003G375400 [Sorghum bicolor]